MAPPDSTQLGLQVAWLFVLAVPIASVAWTITHEEILREPRQYCVDRSRHARRWATRKFYYLFTCEFCFSHYVILAALIVTRYKLLFDDWRGYLLAFFALVWVSNIYMSVYARLRVDIRAERAEANAREAEIERIEVETAVLEEQVPPWSDGQRPARTS